MGIKIRAVEYYLPEGTLTTDDLSREFPEWSADKIAAKTGIAVRHIAETDEFSSDLAIAAGKKLLRSVEVDPESIDFLIVCTQTADFVLPSIASFVQHSLGLKTSIAAIDLNQGCSGFVYALGMAKAVIEAGQAKRVLLITSDTYSKLLNPGDKSVRTIFGDGATATLVDVTAEPDNFVIEYGTDGAGAKSLIVPRGGLRDAARLQPAAHARARSIDQGPYDLFMDGPEIFNFTLRVVPETVSRVLERADLTLDDIDLFVFHQANAFMLEHLRKKLKIPAEKFVMALKDSGNTVSSTIPIALANAIEEGRLREGMQIMLLGFGVGLSWAGTTLKW